MAGHKREFKMYNLRAPEQSIRIVSEGAVERVFSTDRKSCKVFVEETFEEISFSKSLMDYMREKDLSSRDIYERSFVDRKLLHKILSNDDYHPSKKTAFALCIALHLNFEQSRELLRLANYTFARNKRYDIIFEFVLREKIYDIDTINEFLSYYNLPCIGE